jgi:hypothetical protein
MEFENTNLAMRPFLTCKIRKTKMFFIDDQRVGRESKKSIV